MVRVPFNWCFGRYLLQAGNDEGIALIPYVLWLINERAWGDLDHLYMRILMFHEDFVVERLLLLGEMLLKKRVPALALTNKAAAGDIVECLESADGDATIRLAFAHLTMQDPVLGLNGNNVPGSIPSVLESIMSVLVLEGDTFSWPQNVYRKSWLGLRSRCEVVIRSLPMSSHQQMAIGSSLGHLVSMWEHTDIRCRSGRRCYDPIKLDQRMVEEMGEFWVARFQELAVHQPDVEP